jgi:hypothetical protein
MIEPTRHSTGQGLAALTSVFALALLACAEPDAVPPGGAATFPGAAEDADELRGTQPPQGAETIRAFLDPRPGSMMAGTVTVQPRRDAVDVIIEVQAGRAGTTVAARLHSGECADEGPLRAELESIRIQPRGTGRSETTLDLTPGQLFTGAHYVQVYAAEGAPDRALACGDVPLTAASVPARPRDI